MAVLALFLLMMPVFLPEWFELLIKWLPLPVLTTVWTLSLLQCLAMFLPLMGIPVVRTMMLILSYLYG